MDNQKTNHFHTYALSIFECYAYDKNMKHDLKHKLNIWSYSNIYNDNEI